MGASDSGSASKPLEGSVLSVSQRWRRRFDAGFACRRQRQIKRNLNLAGCFLSSIANSGDRRPFNNLGDIAFVGRFR